MTRDLIALWSFIAMATVTSAQLGSSPEFFTSTPKSRNIDTDPKTNSDLDLRELDEAINDFESLERSDTKFISEKVDFIRSSSNVFDLESLDEVMRKIDNEAKNLGLACPSDTVFIVDNTRSDKTTTDQYTEFIMKVIEGLTISAEVDHVGLLTYNGERLNEAIPLGSINEHSKLIKDIKDVLHPQNQRPSSWITQFSQTNQRKDARTNIAILTDGSDIISLEKLVDHLQSPLIKAKIYIVNFHDFKNDFEILTPKVEQVLKGEYSYGKLVHLIKNCGEGVEKRSQLQTSTIKTIETATDANGRYLIPNPKFIGDWLYHYNDKPFGQIKVYTPIKYLPYSSKRRQ